MSKPIIPPQNGKPVTTSYFSWQDMVVREWGAEFNKPDTGYKFSNGEKKDNTDRYQTGIYRKN
jgi:hypothetical protein